MFYRLDHDLTLKENIINTLADQGEEWHDIVGMTPDPDARMWEITEDDDLTLSPDNAHMYYGGYEHEVRDVEYARWLDVKLLSHYQIPAFTVWTTYRVYFPWSTETFGGITSVSRHPSEERTEPV